MKENLKEKAVTYTGARIKLQTTYCDTEATSLTLLKVAQLPYLPISMVGDWSPLFMFSLITFMTFVIIFLLCI